MKSKCFLSAFLVVVIFPIFLLSIYRNNKLSKSHDTAPEITSSEIFDQRISVLTEDGAQYLQLETYIVGVVLGEMPATFEMEALKAQAVVARTFALRRCISESKHSNADVCTDHSCCQAYIAPEDYISEGGNEASLKKVREAVSATACQVLTYDGVLIEATYFSCSGGRTEAAVAVWGSDVPYLQSVESPGEEEAAYYTNTVHFSTADFCQRLGISCSKNIIINCISYTNGGGIESIVINGRVFKGTELRQKLGLRSTSCVLTVVGNSVTVTTKGFGHRVGMSQYGANAMALRGSSYEQILLYYYQGTELDIFKP